MGVNVIPPTTWFAVPILTFLVRDELAAEQRLYVNGTSKGCYT